MSKKLLLLVAILGMGAGVALAGTTDVVELVQELIEPPVAVLGAPRSTADSTDLTTAVRPRLTRKCPRVIVAPTFSDSTATATFEVVVYQRNPNASSTGTTTYGAIALYQTVAACTTTTGGTINGRFPCTDGFLLAPTLSCEVYDVRLVSISTGDVTWTSWTSGTNSVPAKTTAE